MIEDNSPLVSRNIKIKNPLNVTQKNRPKNNYMKETAASLQKKKNKYENNTNSKPFFFTTSKFVTSNIAISQSVRKMSVSQPVCKSSYNWNDNTSYTDNLNHFTDDNNFGNDTYNHFE
jgi:hypothetical protein